MRSGWQALDKASFGLIYGAIMVLSILMALDHQPSAPYRPAIILFGSMLAMTLARALAALLSHGLETGEKIMNVAAFRAAWSGSHPILTVAIVPTAFCIVAGLGWVNVVMAFFLSQFYCVVLLAIMGARTGWIISGGIWHPFMGALSAGGFGSSLAAMRYALT
jgi:hypothetical protein